MTQKNNIFVSKAFFVVIVILMSIPMIQQLTEFAYVRPLKGAVKKVEKPKLTFESWLSGDYQMKEEDYINNNFGFRTSFVRLHNQIDYWLFGRINAKSVLVGNDGYLYELSYIYEYLGRNFLGKDVINQKVATLKSVSDSLSVRGIDLVVLFAAGKASYYPEFFPDSLQSKTKTISNFDYFTHAVDSVGILNIDFNSWFVEMKDTVSYPLFTKGGIHWNKYGEYLVMDSLIRYIEKLRGVKLPYFNVDELLVTSIPRYRDNDIGEGMNLIFPHSTTTMIYPEISIDKSKPWDTVNAMVVADSYYWEMYNEGLSKDVFNNGQFWYYNKKIYSQEPDWATLPVGETDIRAEVEKNDIVFILQTEATLYRFGFGFVEKEYELYAQEDYKPIVVSAEKQQLDALMRNIKANKYWYAKVVEKAKKKGITPEEMLLIDARYIIDQRKKKANNSK